jgi:DNA-binding beta-propeller fold protein YncE
MRTNPGIANRIKLLIAIIVSLTLLSSRLQADTGSCGGASITLPFTDVSAGNVFFCSIAEAFFSGLSNGTSPTTYNPGDPVPREQMAAFVTRTLDQSLKRGSRRAALKQFWTPTSSDDLRLTTVGTGPELVESDGADLWVANNGSDTVSRVRASDGKLLETWTGAVSADGVLAAKGLIFVTGNLPAGKVYQIDPTQPAGAVTTLGISTGDFPEGISFDGARIWTANNGSAGGSVSIVTLSPLSVSTVTTGFTFPTGILYDGANMWVTDQGTVPGKLFKLDSNGAIILTIDMGSAPSFPVFDGTNIWVPNNGSSTITIVRASTGTVLATLTGNGLNHPQAVAFDGERILVTSFSGSNVSLWKASDLSPLGSISTGSATLPLGACSDGLNFWITLDNTGKLARF